MNFDETALQKARDAGYSDDEIQAHLVKSDARYQKAFEVGYKLDEVAAYRRPAPQATTALAETEPQELPKTEQPIGDGSVISPAKTLTGEIQKGNYAEAGSMLYEAIRRPMSGIMGPTEKERFENSIQWGTNEDGSPKYEYKPLGDRLTQEAGLFTPFIKQEFMQSSPDDNAITAIGKASFNTAAGLVGSFLSPAGVMLPMAGTEGTAAKLATGLFTSDMMAQVPEQIHRALNAETTQEKIEGWLGATTSIVMAGLGVKHIAKQGEKPTALSREEIKAHLDKQNDEILQVAAADPGFQQSSPDLHSAVVSELQRRGVEPKPAEDIVAIAKTKDAATTAKETGATATAKELETKMVDIQNNPSKPEMLPAKEVTNEQAQPQQKPQDDTRSTPPPQQPGDAPSQARPPSGESPVAGTEPRGEVPAVESGESTTILNPEKNPVVEVPLSEITLSKDVPNFKEGADPETGIIKDEQLQGSFSRVPIRPVTLWERLNGAKELITGRHRRDLAERSGEKTIPAQILREADGFTKNQALILDAESNIQDGQGSVKDYAHYFKNAANLTEDAARQRGLFSRSKGRAGWDLGRNASDDLYSLFAAGKIEEKAAVEIAKAAPKDEAAQRYGTRLALDGEKPDIISEAVKGFADKKQSLPQAEQTDFFAGTDLDMQFRNEAKKVSEAKSELNARLKLLQAGKKSEIAVSENIDVKNPESIPNRIRALKGELERWSKWRQNPDLAAKVRGETVTETAKVEPTSPQSEKPNQPKEGEFPLSDKTKTPEQVAVEKQKKEQADAIAEEQNRRLIAPEVEIQQDMLGKESDVPLFDRPKSETKAPTDTVPSHLKLSGDVESILKSNPAEPSGMAEPTGAPEGGALFGRGGTKPPPVKAVGSTPLGDKNWLRIPPALKRIGRGLFTEGARRVLERSKNKAAKVLAAATRRHVDIEQELFGQHDAIIRKAVNAIPKKRIDAAFTEASQYARDVENGRTPTPLAADSKSLLDAWYAIGKSTGDIARANNVQVYDGKTGGYRPMGTVKDYIPRMFTEKVEKVLRDPQEDTKFFNYLADAIAVHRGITPEEAAAELRGVAGRFQSNDHMGNLEMARSEKLPEIFYEYDLRNLAARYLPSYSERMAQIISYGQRLGPRENPTKPNLFDIVRREAEDAHTQQWLNEAEDQATGFKQKSGAQVGARRAQAIGNAILLSDPTTTVVRNLLSGLSITTERFGAVRSLRHFREASKLASKIDAKEIGAIRDDIGNFLHSDQLGDTATDRMIRAGLEKALGLSGFTGSENFVRTHNALTAASFARDAAANLAKNPTSRASKEALAMFKRFGVDPEAILAEGANWKSGPETRKFIRTAVRESQGGYRFDQVPLWANSTAGRFFYQYGRWGVQRGQDILQNTIKPAIGEKVVFRGKTMTNRDVLPLMRLGMLTVGLGETYGVIAGALFGKDRRDASLSEIAETFSDDEMKAVGMLGERIVNDVIMAGSFGILGQPIDMLKQAKDQSRLKNPLSPPSISGVQAVVELAQKAADQNGTLTNKDLLDAANSLARGPKNVSDVARNAMDEPLYESQNDMRTLRNAARRWANQIGMDMTKVGGFASMRKSPNAPVFESLNDALLTGDAAKAKAIAAEFIAGSDNKDKAMTAIKASVESRHPFRAGPFTAQKYQDKFLLWARKNLSKQDMEQITRVIKGYEKTAERAGLLSGSRAPATGGRASTNRGTR